MKLNNRYSIIIEHIFRSKFAPGEKQLDFERSEIETVAHGLGIPLPKKYRRSNLYI